MKTKRILDVLKVPLLMLLLISWAIALPILCRPFYFAHVTPYRLEEESGLTRAEIREAYNEMLDYCIGTRKEFSTGVLPWSEEGKAHFTDCRSLFRLDFAVAGGSLLLLLLIALLNKRKPEKPACRPLPCFWAGCLAGGLFLLLGGAILADPDAAFVAFHHVFFPGKTNWLFDPAKDAVITILPEDFFIHCGILIAAVILLGSLVMILAGGPRKNAVSAEKKLK